MVTTGNRESGIDSGEVAGQTATTSKEGRRCTNYPHLTLGGIDDTLIHYTRLVREAVFGMSTSIWIAV